MLLYAITSRVLLAETEVERAGKLVSLASVWAAGGVDCIQVREKDLSASDLGHLAGKIVQAARQSGKHTKILINANPEAAASTALKSGADGVHLPSGLGSDRLAAAIAQIHQTWQASRTSGATPLLSVSCHSTAEVRAARAAGANLALFAPVFEKVLIGEHLRAATSSHPARIAGLGLEALAQACRAAREPSPHPELPVLALGGVTLENAPQCLAAGAAGIAAIRLFAKTGNDSAPAWQMLRGIPNLSPEASDTLA